MKNTSSQENYRLEKPVYDAVKNIVPTDLGRLHIRGPVSPQALTKYQLSEGLCCFRPAKRQHEALIELAQQPDGLVFTAALANKIISYVTFQKPDFPWWIKRCFPKLIELGSIETDMSWRNLGLSKTVLDKVLKNPDFSFFEDYIIIAVHTIHSWDLKNTCISPWDYRHFMLELFKKYDFVPWETEDPEIREHPCNILLARIGANIEPEDIKRFSNCCLDVS